MNSPSSTLLLATHNSGKMREFSGLLAPLLRHFGWSMVSMRDMGLPSPPEDGSTFAENSRIKARYGFTHTQLPTLADDSGLCVDVLDQKPGVMSARWAQLTDGTADFTMAMNRILQNMTGKENRKAAFICSLTLIQPDSNQSAGHREYQSEGILHGQIHEKIEGDGGFGYDPIFIPQSHDQTLAILPPAVKACISHRALAVKNLIAGTVLPSSSP